MKTGSIILCAGVGTRMKSAKSKLLHELLGKPLCYWPIKNALALSSTKPIVVLSHQAKEVEEVLRFYFHDTLVFAYQESPNGTGGAVKAAIKNLDPECTNVVVLYGDSPLLKKESLANLIARQRSTTTAVALLSSLAPNPTGYGRIVRARDQEISAIVEEQNASSLEKTITEVNAGTYVFDADFLRNNIDKITNNNVKKEYYITDLVHLYMKDGAKLGPVASLSVPYEEMHGVNDRCQLAYAENILRHRLLVDWMLEGVTIIDPQSTIIEESVRLAKDVVIYPGVHLRGKTHIGEATIIENGCVIKDTVIEKNAHILPYSCCDQAYIGENTEVGPFARLRPEARLENNVKVGNFVEVKRARLKKGVKAGHLAYIGDAEIGENSNIGAGTITCNYDGKNKHRTLIGDGCFIGSNSTLIAPLAIGHHAYVAGGSTITDEVPSKSLAIGRSRQVNKTQRLLIKESRGDAVVEK